MLFNMSIDLLSELAHHFDNECLKLIKRLDKTAICLNSVVNNATVIQIKVLRKNQKTWKLDDVLRFKMQGIIDILYIINKIYQIL